MARQIDILMRPQHIPLLLMGRKWHTRRCITKLPATHNYDRFQRVGEWWTFEADYTTGGKSDPVQWTTKCRYGIPQDEPTEYWVKEATQVLDMGTHRGEYCAHVRYLDHGVERQCPITTKDCKALEQHQGHWEAQSPMFMRKSFARVWLTGIKTWAETLGEMTPNDAIAEGYPTLAEYRQAWNDINPNHLFQDDRWVWGVEFELKS